MIKREIAAMRNVLAIDVVMDHIERKLALEYENFPASKADITVLKAIVLQYANANSVLSVGTPLIPFQNFKNDLGEHDFIHVDSPKFDDKSIMMRYVTDALSQVLHIDFQSVMEGNHPSIDIKPLVDAWNEYFEQLPRNEAVSLKDSVTHLSIETFSTVVHKPVPHVLQKDVAEEIYQRSMDV
ncbi:TPA: hypothetical protein ACN331_002450 [Vibrio parahaemolyticus]|uniref:hypothetical protein n=2 Tax=Vibrionaceae TaxID=641 RepID=UPI0015D230BC|nr:hypothetical protein [Vibrio parahaemolyticus]MBE4385064.1 hypothetical protein [Vibrio parahaemolyticus]MEA5230172.1 hypothetical protein [Vibrio parahaemolyticus]NYU23826.1 hypothetical protein [Vibrio parahaemolyticus]WHT06033.1 hypothetical protein O2T11_25635 [Vibrio parahaemolyticus]